MTLRPVPVFRAYDLPAGTPAALAGEASRPWHSIEAKDDTTATVRIYEPIGGWFGTGAAEFAEEVAALDVDTIDLRLNSPGGSVFDGVAIYNTLVAHRARVDVTVDGVAASIASVIAMAGDSVTMGRGSRMMIHNPSAGVIGQAKDFREFADLLDEIGRDIAGFYAHRAGGEVDQWLASMDAETWYSAREAADAGLADSVLGDDKPSNEAPKVFDLSAYGFRYADREHAPAPGVAAHTRRATAAMARVRATLKGAK
jgi:ATP-dependent Clp endopeptidase proteolytic subunit ClpP